MQKDVQMIKNRHTIFNFMKIDSAEEKTHFPCYFYIFDWNVFMMIYDVKYHVDSIQTWFSIMIYNTEVKLTKVNYLQNNSEKTLNFVVGVDYFTP